ncbi:MAG: hypothetical protein KF768_10415 [Phycisphaeraceae bacterium]|nr:hypothetical protein [Phycisphaeraceae bacterium]
MTTRRTTLAIHSQRNAAKFVALALALAIAAASGCNSGSATSDAERVRLDEANAARKALEHVREAERLERNTKNDLAIEEYLRAVRLYRELPAAWNNLGRLLMIKGENNAAAEAFRIAADLSPADPKPVYNLGALWESMGWPDDASRYYTEALARDQNHLPSLRRSILLDVNLGRATDQTENRLRRALLLESDPDWRGHLMRAQVRMRDGSLTVGNETR